MTNVCLIILDGWGLAPPGPGNAISQAHTPVFDELWERYDHTQLTACGSAVGLPEGQMGNSEVGHLNIGAGAVIKQDLMRIDEAVANDELVSNPVIVDAFSNVERVHLIGLVSDGGVHSSIDHLHALIAAAAKIGVADLVIHAFTDGRDTLPTSGVHHIERVQAWCDELGCGRIASVIGRYYGMDRDNRWDRTQAAYDLLVAGKGKYTADTAVDAVAAAYARDETDEFISATVVNGEGRIRPGDSVLTFNFRPDRMRQITRALADGSCTEIDRHGVAPVSRYTTFTQYEEDWTYPVAYRPERPTITLADVIEANGLSQLHVAETEKYAHVTYFLNGGNEQPHEHELRELIPSVRDVPTYDHKPEMRAQGVANAFVELFERDRPAFSVINFANADMVGHTGSIPATIKAVEAVDQALGVVVNSVHSLDGCCVITADHGNADNMLEPDGSPNTAHSTNPVPFLVTVDGMTLERKGGILADVAPTVLALLGIKQPGAMTGRSLLAGVRQNT